jgi:hypothetical protein
MANAPKTSAERILPIIPPPETPSPEVEDKRKTRSFRTVLYYADPALFRAFNRKPATG